MNPKPGDLVTPRPDGSNWSLYMPDGSTACKVFHGDMCLVIAVTIEQDVGSDRELVYVLTPQGWGGGVTSFWKRVQSTDEL